MGQEGVSTGAECARNELLMTNPRKCCAPVQQVLRLVFHAGAAATEATSAADATVRSIVAAETDQRFVRVTVHTLTCTLSTVRVAGQHFCYTFRFRFGRAFLNTH